MVKIGPNARRSGNIVDRRQGMAPAQHDALISKLDHIVNKDGKTYDGPAQRRAIRMRTPDSRVNPLLREFYNGTR